MLKEMPWQEMKYTVTIERHIILHYNEPYIRVHVFHKRWKVNGTFQNPNGIQN